MAIIDTKSFKCIGVRGPRGYDGAEKLVGRKRVVMVDAEGHIPVLSAVPGDVQDCDTSPALDAGKEEWPSLRLAILDGVFRGKRCEVVKKELGQKGFVVLKRRVVERTSGWISHWGSLRRERASRLDVATARLCVIACLMALIALTSQNEE
ncbi:hypothetical protein VQ03_02405 [Methylobacterium tarhaniae]|uniref:Transposase IS4-like domain-containing protein n=1 Tax=Methylobacterium tarhaniae TaxID=1187852 RepID=A0A0J6VZ72_9HYPH|nr:hypothetical protein [Methylobacterium tarhaniae]KMO44626.1 hypothetical protein VQ03_02405 [Methylobacterium tarhaniae]